VDYYLAQLEEEGLAQRQGAGWMLPWGRIFQLTEADEHRSSIGLLQLPPQVAWTARLESRGTPSDSNFRVVIAGWRDERGSPVPGVQRMGAVLSRGLDRFLMSAGVWALVGGVRALAVNGAGLSGEERLRAAGVIRRLAVASGAQLDRYLEQTRISVPETIELRFTKQEALGTSVVEVIPEPAGAPSEFVAQFDRYETVRKRYDVPTADGGTTHVVPGKAALAALQSVKAMPGRRVASGDAAAFLRNPKAVLGEEAAEAIDDAAFTEARLAAGILFKRAFPESHSGADAFAIRLVDVDGTVADEIRHVADRTAIEALRDSAQRSLERGLQLYAWDGEDIECGSETEALLIAIQEWLGRGATAALAIRFAEVFDLTAYSDRVVGFDGKPVAVPYIARKDADKGWVPDNIEYGLAPLPGADGEAMAPVSLPPERLVELACAVAEARARGDTSVVVEGLPESVPIEQAEAWVKAFEEDGGRHRETRDPKIEKEPDGSLGRPILRILHNIERHDYGLGSVPGAPGASMLCDPALPASLAATTRLLPHQSHGLAWLQARLAQRRRGISGCLLADDMGLGKTLQALSLIARYRESDPQARPCLVVAPVSLLVNWRSEVDRFFDRFPGRVTTAYGDALRELRSPTSAIDPELREAGLKRFLRPDFEQGSGLILTTYETLRDYEFSFGRVHWGIVVCDEAQKIKTPKALVTRAAKALRADFKIACTGTPVENTLADLWCLFDFFQPGLLGSLNEFTNDFRRSIEMRMEGHERKVDTLRTAIEPWVLRRMKDEVADLPPKHQGLDPLADPACAALPMSELQQRLYAVSVQEFRSAMKTRDEKSGMRILGLLHRLRTICSNPAAAAYDHPEGLGVDEHLRHSPKLRWMVGRLGEIRRKGEKVIVFTEFRDIQRIVQRVIAQRFDVVPDIVNGSTSVDPEQEVSRQRLIDRFQAKPGFGVIILSTTAVGFGVNVQAANHVIHFTRPWNPAKEDQATDRAYRIGQTKPVHVYCPTVCGNGFESFDQRIDQLLGNKRALSRDMLAGAQELKIDEFGSL
jgi:hypothetical protein